MNFFKIIFCEYKKYIIFSLFIFIGLGISSYYYFKEKEEIIPPIEEGPKEEIKNTAEKSVDEPVFFYVDLKGEVKNPGVYLIESTKIVNDVILLGGGLTNKANTKNINLSKRVQNEMMIYVPSVEEKEERKETKEQKEAVIPSKININTASIDELIFLPGIGESKAKAIIDYREESSFSTIEEILLVPGIGEALFDKIKDYITV